MTFETEASLAAQGLVAIGVDEAGRGALAGPVVAAAVILDPSSIPDGIDDSKRLSPERRSTLAELICNSALAWGLGSCSAARIDEINILQATYEAMHEAIGACRARVPFTDEQLHLLIDGNRFRPHPITHTTIIKGDGLILSIAAASILAKTHRDAIMSGEIDRTHPNYGFDRHKGYGTEHHRRMISEHGASSVHRTTFLRALIAQPAPSDGTSG
ncbi:MAG: ribonuclease HII [Candidatus Kapabacteria bacterium]|nr:ribonuclease HII [Candidatus Kapabacteria bacterium]